MGILVGGTGEIGFQGYDRIDLCQRKQLSRANVGTELAVDLRGAHEYRRIPCLFDRLFQGIDAGGKVAPTKASTGQVEIEVCPIVVRLGIEVVARLIEPARRAHPIVGTGKEV